jgi:LysR family transcriptional regulator, hydrogen peroxide-inducible genes activator
MLVLPSMKQLQYLTALQEHGHFGKAADACFVTQSTLSAGLRDLETALGVMLVERTKRVVRFTPTGDKVARKAYGVLREATELAQLARAASTPLSGDLRLGVIPTIASFFLPRMLPGQNSRNSNSICARK